MDSQLSFSFHLVHVSFAPCSPTLFVFFPTCDQRQSTMVQVVRLPHELATADGVAGAWL
jgi:hypothetical protein